MVPIPPLAPPPGNDAGPDAPTESAPRDQRPAAASAAPAATVQSGAKPDAKAEREARLAAALRENLKRRKGQARARRSPGDNGNV